MSARNDPTSCLSAWTLNGESPEPPEPFHHAVKRFSVFPSHTSSLVHRELLLILIHTRGASVEPLLLLAGCVCVKY